MWSESQIKKYGFLMNHVLFITNDEWIIECTHKNNIKFRSGYFFLLDQALK